MENQVDDEVLERLTIEAYDATADRKAAQATEKDKRLRLEMAMDLKKVKYYKASDGTEAELPDGKRKLKLKREKDEDESED